MFPAIGWMLGYPGDTMCRIGMDRATGAMKDK